jgi:TonB family protein
MPIYGFAWQTSRIQPKFASEIEGRYNADRWIGGNMRTGVALIVCLLLGTAAAQGQTQNPVTSASAEPAPQARLPDCDDYYPAADAATGTTAIGFYVTSKGDVSNVSVIHSSGNANLDSAALTCVANAHLTWDMENQQAISGGFVANGSAVVRWAQGKHATLFIGCPYPIIPVRLQQQGTVEVSFQILKDGTVSKPIVTRSSGFHDLDNAALSCVATEKYVPVSRAGVPVDFDWHTTLTFRLEN